jgi:hypothetical protein
MVLVSHPTKFRRVSDSKTCEQRHAFLMHPPRTSPKRSEISIYAPQPNSAKEIDMIAAITFNEAHRSSFPAGRIPEPAANRSHPSFLSGAYRTGFAPMLDLTL